MASLLEAPTSPATQNMRRVTAAELDELNRALARHGRDQQEFEVDDRKPVVGVGNIIVTVRNRRTGRTSNIPPLAERPRQPFGHLAPAETAAAADVERRVSDRRAAFEGEPARPATLRTSMKSRLQTGLEEQRGRQLSSREAKMARTLASGQFHSANPDSVASSRARRDHL